MPHSHTLYVAGITDYDELRRSLVKAVEAGVTGKQDVKVRVFMPPGETLAATVDLADDQGALTGRVVAKNSIGLPQNAFGEKPNTIL